MPKYVSDEGLRRFYDNLNGKFLDYGEVITVINENKSVPLNNDEIVSSMIASNEVWIKVPDGWGELLVQIESTGDPIILETALANENYYVFDVSNIPLSADQFVVSDGTNTTLSLDGLYYKVAIESMGGKLIKGLTANSNEFEYLPG